jgi:hypothetical protein
MLGEEFKPAQRPGDPNTGGTYWQHLLLSPVRRHPSASPPMRAWPIVRRSSAIMTRAHRRSHTTPRADRPQGSRLRSRVTAPVSSVLIDGSCGVSAFAARPSLPPRFATEGAAAISVRRLVSLRPITIAQ